MFTVDFGYIYLDLSKDFKREKAPEQTILRAPSRSVKPNSHLMRHDAARRVTVRQKQMLCVHI